MKLKLRLNQDRAVGKATSLWAQKLAVCTVAEAKCLDQLWGLPSLLFNGHWGFFQGVK